MSAYSDIELHCEGHACAKCSLCRDWYWRPDGDKKVYEKRIDARCFYQYGGYPHHPGGYTHYFYDDYFGISTGNDDYDRYRFSRIGDGLLLYLMAIEADLMVGV
ncbi:unnamed protein product [Rotaria magnacalcarata]